MKVTALAIILSGVSASEFLENQCYPVIMAAYKYYSNVLEAVRSEKSHGRKFTGSFVFSDAFLFESRMEMFKFNMEKWANRLDQHSCECPFQYYLTIGDAFDPIKPTGKISTEKYHIANFILR